MQKTIYDSFRTECGTVVEEISNSEYKETFEKLSKRQLKKALSKLKSNKRSELEIRYASNLIKRKYEKKQINVLDHDEKLSKNFWSYCKDIFEKDEIIKPGFDKVTCETHFKNTMKHTNHHKSFEFPAWMKLLENPSSSFNDEKPTYREITNIINKMKSSGSPCPHDQMSIIILKRCPILRTIIHKIISHCWMNKIFPRSWKHAFTILIHKKGDENDPSNFRPITLQPVFAKVYSSLIRNRIYNFLTENHYIESRIQKGFWKGVSGTIEHTKLLSHMRNHARGKQRQIIITLLDLKNAFGEVDHRLLLKTLECHHIPENIKLLISEYYGDDAITIATDQYKTTFQFLIFGRRKNYELFYLGYDAN